MVSADLNYAAADGSRGDSWCEVLLDGDRTMLRGEWQGPAHPYECFVDEAPVGTQVTYDGRSWWVKLRLRDGRLVLSRGSGRASEDAVVDPAVCTM